MKQGQYQVGVIVGSLRRDSFNLAVAKALCDMAPPALKLVILSIGELPLYNQDYDSDSPSAYGVFRDKIYNCDAVLFVTPEHNRSVPAAMKNAVDIGSRPPGHNVWKGKPAAVISASPSMQGGFGANHHLRQSLMCLDVYCMPNPEVYLSQVGKLLEASGGLTEDGKRILTPFLERFEQWITNFSVKS